MEYRITCGNPGCKKVFKGKTETDVRGRLSQHAHSTECFKAPGASEEQWIDLAWIWTGEQEITTIQKPVNPPPTTPPPPTPALLPGGSALEAASTAFNSAAATAQTLRNIEQMMEEMLGLVQHIYHWTRPTSPDRGPTRHDRSPTRHDRGPRGGRGHRDRSRSRSHTTRR